MKCIFQNEFTLDNLFTLIFILSTFYSPKLHPSVETWSKEFESNHLCFTVLGIMEHTNNGGGSLRMSIKVKGPQNYDQFVMFPSIK